MADLKDFSSFDPDQEKAFVPFESVMKENEKRANTLGFGIAGGFFILSALSVILLYTPCSRFCERPPSACKEQKDLDAFKQNCHSACAAVERERGLTITREIKVINKENKKEEFEPHQAKVDGTEFVDMLASCAFSGGGGTTCDSITKQVIPKGLWCAEKK